jgi:hypothetical protein
MLSMIGAQLQTEYKNPSAVKDKEKRTTKKK